MNASHNGLNKNGGLPISVKMPSVSTKDQGDNIVNKPVPEQEQIQIESGAESKDDSSELERDAGDILFF